MKITIPARNVTDPIRSIGRSKSGVLFVCMTQIITPTFGLHIQQGFQ
jgi:hypothetical protein